jgi:hypothetical protein
MVSAQGTPTCNNCGVEPNEAGINNPVLVHDPHLKWRLPSRPRLNHQVIATLTVR